MAPLFFAIPHSRRNGIALLAALAMLSILSLTIVLFISLVTPDRLSTYHYSQGLRAEAIARSGLATLVSQMRGEITDASRSASFPSGSLVLYRPLTNASVVPERMASLPTAPAAPALANVMKMSLPGAPFFSGQSLSGTNLASSDRTDAASANGRSVPLSRWNQPLLLSSTNNLPAPRWVYVGREGPFLPAPGDRSTALGNTNAVLGRYAYVVYDVGGLIDANVSGYSSFAFSAAQAALKGPPAWIDLTRLTNASTGKSPSASDVNAFILWRNQASAASAASYATYVSNAASQGFARVSSGDTAFLNRQELIRYAQTLAPTLTNALPYLTTFSRTVNGPVWGPLADGSGAPYDYLSHQYKPTTTSANAVMNQGTSAATVAVPYGNVYLLNPRVKTAYLSNGGAPRHPGDPLLSARFPLSKLALLEKMQGTGTLNATEIADIQKYFGLDIAPDITAGSGYYRHWTYPTTNTAYKHTAGKILTLDDVAALSPGRDPDFFELLQAGILSGSLGVPGRADLNGTLDGNDPDLNPCYQVMRIGACLIDQWDADSYPTTITFNGYDFYGVEDLPYPDRFLVKAYSSSATVATTYTLASPLPVALYFELWNPHRDLGNSSGTLRPATFRLRPATTATYSYDVVVAAGTSTYRWITPGTDTWPALTGNNGGGLNSGGTMIFSAAEDDFREPSLIAAAKAAPTCPTLPTSAVSPAIVGLQLASLQLPAAGTQSTTASPSGTTTWPPTAGTAWQFKFGGTPLLAKDMGSIDFFMDYLGPDGQYHPYSLFVGVGNAAGATLSGSGMGLGSSTPPSNSTSPSSTNVSWTKSDPRTGRLGFACSYGSLPLAGASAAPSASAASCGPYAMLPLGAYGRTASSASPFRADLWAVNDATAVNPSPPPFYHDNDTVVRPGDAAASYPLGRHPFYQNVTQTAPLPAGSAAPGYVAEPSRPVVLNRPFQSVGDLGYAFRDMPWRTLDFLSAKSPDAALLDLFSLDEGDVVSSRVDLNVAPVPVLAALLGGTALGSSGTAGPLMTGAQAAAVASVIHDAAATAPFRSRADLVTSIAGQGALLNVSANHLKTEIESAVRALAETTDTRTWNLLVDVIAQSGSYPAPRASGSATGFVVDGERRYWLHLAIDRYTSQIVDQQLEVVDGQ